MADVDPFGSATALVAALRAGTISSAALAELYIRRIERHDRGLNAVVVRDFTRAREQAVAADHARGRGEARPLQGLPITLKESINVTGLHTCCGVPDWKGFISQHDAPAASRMFGAGAVLLGKTNVPPMLADWQSANPVYGKTNNPWDLGRTPGAAAAAARPRSRPASARSRSAPISAERSGSPPSSAASTATGRARPSCPRAGSSRSRRCRTPRW